MGVSTAAGKYKGIKNFCLRNTHWSVNVCAKGFECYLPVFSPQVSVVHMRLIHRLASSNIASLTFYTGIQKAVITTVKYSDRS